MTDRSVGVHEGSTREGVLEYKREDRSVGVHEGSAREGVLEYRREHRKE